MSTAMTGLVILASVYLMVAAWGLVLIVIDARNGGLTAHEERGDPAIRAAFEQAVLAHLTRTKHEPFELQVAPR